MSDPIDLERPSRRIAPIPAETRRRLARRLAGDAAADAVPPADATPPADPSEAVRAAVAGRIGLVRVGWPGLGVPLWARAGSLDPQALIAAMQGGVAALDLPFLPRRIVEIGAPYLAVALAAAFPESTIASIDPAPAHSRLHSLLTLPWRQIVAIRNAVGVEGALLSETIDPASGAPRLVPDPQGALTSVSLDRVFGLLGWDEADLLVVDPALCPALADPAAGAAFTRIRRIVIRPAAAAPPPAGLAARFPPPTHRIEARGDDLLVERPGAGSWYPRRPDPVFDLAGKVMEAELPSRSDYAPTGDTGFRLRPAPQGAAPTRLAIRRFVAGPERFEADLRATPVPGPPLALAIGFVAAETGRTIHREIREIHPGEVHHWHFVLPAFFGELRIVFEAALVAPGEGGWLEIHDPRLG